MTDIESQLFCDMIRRQQESKDYKDNFYFIKEAIDPITSISELKLKLVSKKYLYKIIEKLKSNDYSMINYSFFPIPHVVVRKNKKKEFLL